jgi:hypothetical protein
MERASVTRDMKILRKMCGLMYENGYQRIKMIKSPGIATVIKVVRVDGERTVKILERQPGRSEKRK